MFSIQCKELTKRYRRKIALENINLSIEDGKIIGLIGRNGAGKTTLLKLLTGYYKKSSGDIKVFGKNPFDSLEIAQNLIFVDDNMAFPSSYSLEDIVEQAGKFYMNLDKELAYKLMDYFNISKRSAHGDLSKGMKSTFNSILGLSAHAAITLLDEPTTGMDISVRKDFYKALLKDYIKNPRTIIMSSHLLGEFEDLLEEIVLIDSGKLITHMDMNEFKEHGIELRNAGEKVNLDDLDLEVIYREDIGINGEKVIVKNTLNGSDIQELKFRNIDINGVSSEDLCVYLTAPKKGAIGDVFK